MIRKLILRCLLLGFVFLVVVVTAACFTGYYAIQQPEFYTTLRDEKPSEYEQKMTTLYFKQTVHELEQWTARSIARQQGQPTASVASPLAYLTSAFQGEYNPREDVRAITITEKQINTLIASQKATSQGDWRNPRLRFQQDHVDFAFEIVTQEISCVMSASLKPTLTDDGRLRFDLLGARVGKVPLPLGLMLSYLPDEVNVANEDMELHLTASTPHVYFNLPVTSAEVPSVAALECTDGAISLELLPPVVEAVNVASR